MFTHTTAIEFGGSPGPLVVPIVVSGNATVAFGAGGASKVARGGERYPLAMPRLTGKLMRSGLKTAVGTEISINLDANY